MISDSTLYTLSIFLGSLAMLLIILYHYLEINSRGDDDNDDNDDNDSNDNSEKTPPDLAGSADEKAGVVAAGKSAPQTRNTSAGFDRGNMTGGSMNKGGARS